MASLFNIKGTTQNEFRIGINGPIIKRYTNDATDAILLPNNIYTTKIYFGNIDNYIDSLNYSGTAAVSKKLANKIKIVSGDLNVTIDSNEIDASEGNQELKLTISKINSVLLDGNIAFDRIKNLIGTTENSIAAGNHNHNGTYIGYGKTIVLPETSDLKFNNNVSSYTIVSTSPITLDLKLKDNTVSSSILQDNSISTEKIIDDAVTVDKIAIGDYSSKITLVQKAVSADSAGSATKLTNSRELWGQSFDGTKDISGLMTNVDGITPSSSGSFDLGSSTLKYRNIFLSGALNGNSLNLSGNANISGTLQAGSSTVSSLSTGTLTATGTSTLKDINASSLTISGNGTINGTLKVLGTSTFSGNIDATGKTITAQVFNGSLTGSATSAHSLVTPRLLWGNSFDGSKDISGSINLSGNNITNVSQILPPSGIDNTAIGSSSNGFKDIYATTFHGALSGNATSATTASKVSSSLTVNGLKSGTASYNGSSNVVLNLAASNISGLEDFIDTSSPKEYKGIIVFSTTEKTLYTPSGNSGDYYIISIPDNISGCTLNGVSVKNNSLVICIADSTPAGNSDNVSDIVDSWKYIIIPEKTISTSSSSVTDGSLLVFDGTTGTLVRSLAANTYINKTSNENVSGIKTFEDGIKFGNWDLTTDNLILNNINYTLPSSSGTLALDSDISTAVNGLKDSLNDIIITGDTSYNLFDNAVTFAKIAKTGNYTDLATKPVINIDDTTPVAETNSFQFVSGVSSSATSNGFKISLTRTEIPKATSSKLGLVKTGYENNPGSKNYAVSSDSNGNLYTNVPWSDTNTTYTFTSGSNGTFSVKPSDGSSQTVSIGKPSTAGTADNARKTIGTLKFKYGENYYPNSFNGSEDVTFDFGDFFQDLNSVKYKGTINFTSTSKTAYTPAGNSGDMYFISCNPSTLDGCTLNGVSVSNGDTVICNKDNTVQGNATNQTTVAKNWNIIKSNNIDESDLVHLDGTETITGNKIFEGKLITPELYANSGSAGKITIPTTAGTMARIQDLNNIIIAGDNTSYNLFDNDVTLSKVAKTGSYNDLSNTPTIPDGVSIPNSNSDVTKFIYNLSANNFAITPSFGFLKSISYNSAANSVPSSEEIATTSQQSLLLNKIAKTGINISYTGTGNVISDIEVDDSDTSQINVSRITALTSHQTIKKLNTNNTTSQTASSSEAITGSGTINLHKVAKTGNYNDLLNRPTIPTIPDISIEDSGTGTYVTGAIANGHKITLSHGGITEATTAAYGGIKLAGAKRSTQISTTQGGTTSGRYYGLEIDSTGKAFVNVPWVSYDLSNYVTLNTAQTLETSATKRILGSFIFGADGSDTTIKESTKTVGTVSKSVLDIDNVAYFEAGLAAIGSGASQQGIYTNYISGMSSSGSNTNLILNYDGSNTSAVSSSRQILLGSNTIGSNYSNTLAKGGSVTNPLYQYGLVRGDTLRQVLNKDLYTSAQWINSTQLTNENLNSFNSETTCGFYHAGGSNSVTNKPSNVDAFGLIVFRSANGYFTQLLYCGTGTGSAENLFTRHYTGGSWTEWRRILSVVQGDLTSGRVLVSGSNDVVTSSNITTTELNYLDGVTSNVQTQLNNLSSRITTNTNNINTNKYEANLNWGGRNISGSISPIDAALSSVHSANIFAFANPAGISVEYSTNGGSTWTDYALSDADKIKLVSGIGASIKIGKKSSGSATTSDQVRITFTSNTVSGNMGVYAKIRKLLINLTTNGASGSRVTIEGSKIGSDTTFTTIKSNVPVSGWSGWNSIDMDGTVFGGSASQTSQYRRLRLTFSITGVNSNYASILTISDIAAYGDAKWTTNSNLAENNHVYSYDYNQNVTFPKNVTASSFIGDVAGDVSGNASTATTLKTSRTLWGQPFNGSKNISGNLSSVGNISPTSDSTYNIGTDTNRFANVYSDNVNVSSSINLAGTVFSNVAGDVLGTRKPLTKIANTQLYVEKGIVFGGTAAAAGLVTRGICGIGTPESDGTCSKENLYINYDGANTFNASRQVVLQAGTVGTHYGNNLYQYTAARGDAVKGYGDAHYAAKDHTHSYNSLIDKPTIPTVNNATITIQQNGATKGTFTLNQSGNATISLTDNNTDTKNTAGSTNTTSKIYLIGATSQTTNPQTYSNSGIYGTNGVLTTSKTRIGGGNVTLEYNTEDECLDFVF